MSIHVNSITIRTSDLDCFDRVKPYAYLEFYQDIAGEHADILGVGYEASKKLNVGWVLMKSKLEIFKNPVPYDTLLLQTWPSNLTKVDFSRDYRLLDKEGELISQGTSQWCIVDINTHRILRTSTINFPEGVQEKPLYTARLEKLSEYDYSNQEVKYSHTIRNSDLDHYGHTNNARYAVMLFDALPNTLENSVHTLEINYIAEAKLGETIDLYYSTNNKLIKGVGVIRETAEKESRLSFSFEINLY